MQAFKVTFRFGAPVLRDSEYPVHLDALIAAAAMRDHLAAGTDNPWLAADDLSAYLDRTDGEAWVWKASQLHFEAASARQWMNHIRRSEPAQYFEDLGKYWVGKRTKAHGHLGINPESFKIDTRSGQQRGYQWLAAVQWIDTATAFGVGDIDAVQDVLMRQITHVGKKGVNGYGRVTNIVVEPAAESELDNWRLRVLPAGVPGKSGIQYEPVLACVRAPYWRKLDRVMAQEPII